MDMNKINKNNKTTLYSVACGISLLVASALPAKAADLQLDQIAAVVNQDVVLMSEAQVLARKLRASDTNSSNKTLLIQAIDQLILDKLQVQSAKRSNMRADTASIDRAEENIAQRNNMNLTQLKQALQKEGTSYKKFRERLADRLLINSLKSRQSRESANVSEQEVSDLLSSEATQVARGQSYYVQDLLIAAPSTATIQQFNQARQQANQLRTLSLSSPDFLSTRHANNRATDLGWQDSRQLSFAYLKALNNLKPGQISDVVHDARGFHVLKLVEKRGAAAIKAQQVRVRHILIARTETNALEKAETIRQQLQQGADFSVLAKANSADKVSALNGGHLGWGDSKRYVPSFAKAAESLALNTLSPVIETRFGYHILEVLDRREVDASQAELEGRARKAIIERRKEQDYEAWVQGLRSNAFIDYRVK